MGNRLPDEAPGKPPGGASDDSAALIGALQHSLTRRSTKSQERWTALKQRYDPHLLAHARARIGTGLARVIDPEEIVDEAWIRVFQSWDGFRYEKKHALRAWLCLQVDRVILDRCRRERRRPPELLLGVDSESSSRPAEPAAPQSGPATIVAKKDQREKVVNAIDGLPDIYRRVLKAIWIEEKSREAVAKELHIKPNTLNVQLKRGMEILRSKLDQDLV